MIFRLTCIKIGWTDGNVLASVTDRWWAYCWCGWRRYRTAVNDLLHDGQTVGRTDGLAAMHTAERTENSDRSS